MRANPPGDRSNTAPATVSAVGLSGVWGPLIGQTDTRRSFQAGTPTEMGAAAQRTYTSAENPEALCIPGPTPASIDGGPYLHEIDIREDVIFIRTEYFSIERTVYMDGRGHPENGERSNQGHSIRFWEEEILVVDTTLFADYRSGNLDGIPSGTGKHVVERYSLSPDRTQLIDRSVGGVFCLPAGRTRRRDAVGGAAPIGDGQNLHPG